MVREFHIQQILIIEWNNDFQANVEWMKDFVEFVVQKKHYKRYHDMETG